MIKMETDDFNVFLQDLAKNSFKIKSKSDCDQVRELTSEILPRLKELIWLIQFNSPEIDNRYFWATFLKMNKIPSQITELIEYVWFLILWYLEAHPEYNIKDLREIIYNNTTNDICILEGYPHDTFGTIEDVFGIKS